MELRLPRISLPDAIGGGPDLPVRAPVANVVDASLDRTLAVSRDAALVQKPVSAAARGLEAAPRAQVLARQISMGLSVVLIGASIARGAQVVERDGADALVRTKAGRGATLGAIGGSLLLVPAPPAQLAGAIVLTGGVANEFDLLKPLDKPQGSGGTPRSPGR